MNEDYEFPSKQDMNSLRYEWLRGAAPSSCRWQRIRIEHWTGEYWEPLCLEELDSVVDDYVLKEAVVKRNPSQ